jgi:hypothetical protein
MPSSRTVATSELVVPRSMPIARLPRPLGRRLVGLGDLQQRHQVTCASISSRSPASLSRNLSSRTRARAAADGACASRSSPSVDSIAFASARTSRSSASSAASSRASRRLGGTLAALELPLEEVDVERRVGLVERVDAAQPEQVARALDRVAERSVRLVHASGGLQREAARRVVGRGVAVGMDRALERAVRGVERLRVERVARRQAEELEMVAREVQHGGNSRAGVARTPAIG